MPCTTLSVNIHPTSSAYSKAQLPVGIWTEESLATWLRKANGEFLLAHLRTSVRLQQKKEFEWKGVEHIKYHFLLFITWHPERLATLKFIQGRSKCADELKLSYLDASDASGQQLPSAEKTMLALNFLKVSMIWSAPELMRTSWASVNRIILFVSSTCRFNSSFNKLTLVPNPSYSTPKPSILKDNPFTSADRWNLFTGPKKFVATVSSKSLLSSSKKSISSDNWCVDVDWDFTRNFLIFD